MASLMGTCSWCREHWQSFPDDFFKRRHQPNFIVVDELHDLAEVPPNVGRGGEAAGIQIFIESACIQEGCKHFLYSVVLQSFILHAVAGRICTRPGRAALPPPPVDGGRIFVFDFGGGFVANDSWQIDKKFIAQLFLQIGYGQRAAFYVRSV